MNLGLVGKEDLKRVAPNPFGLELEDEADVARAIGDFGQLTKPRTVIGGSDSRYWIGHGTAFNWPPITSVVFRDPGNEGGGSGTNIGRFTTMACAHSFHSPGGGAGAHWFSTMNWTVARVATSTTPFGATTYTIGYPYMNSAGILGCYSVTFPASFLQGNSEGDFAIVEYLCGHQPGQGTGWMGPAHAAASRYASSTLSMFAYDSDSTPASPYAGLYYQDKSMIGRAAFVGDMLIDPVFPFILKHKMDTEGGASGGGVLSALWADFGDTTQYWIGDHTGGIDANFNSARVLTAGSFAFIQAHSTEY